ncbi:hypothetical protein LT493_19965 [Streptomyces tricolor]|nr:hypothetical protein [Streptomyces tricolor]
MAELTIRPEEDPGRAGELRPVVQAGRGLARGGRYGHPCRRRHREGRGPALGHGQRTAEVRGRHPSASR